MAHVDPEVPPPLEWRDEFGGLRGGNLPRCVAAPALEVAVFEDGQHVELLATVRGVTVTHDPDLLEDVERPVDG